MNDPKDFAPGAPGMEPHRVKTALSGLGTSFNGASRVTFSLSKGIVSEIGYPDASSPCAHDLQWIVTDGEDFFSEEQRHTDHEVLPLEEGIPAFRVNNTCHQGKYRLSKEVITDPMRDTLLVKSEFSALEKGTSGDPYQLFLTLSPFIGGNAQFHNARVTQYKGLPILVAQKGSLVLAMACSHPWKKTSVGFSGVSDAWMDLAAHRTLTRQYRLAESGRVSLAAEIDLYPLPVAGQAARTAGWPDKEIILTLSFGLTEREAAAKAWASLLEGFEAARERYVSQWRGWQRGLSTTVLSGAGLMKQSLVVLRWLESKNYAGAFLSEGGVRPRDLGAAFDAYLAVDAREDALRLLSFLMGSQDAAGHWSTLLHADGTSASPTIALDQVAQIILMADACRKAFLIPPSKMQRYWPLLWKAAAVLVSSGPHFGADRWNEPVHPSVHTLSVTIAALLAAADMADERTQPGIATYCRKTADHLQENIDRWLYVLGNHGIPGVKGCYEGPDALALVRYGLRSPDDPRILDSVRVIDATLKTDSLNGPGWKRREGETLPLLTAERAWYELQAGNLEMAAALKQTLESVACQGIFATPGSNFPDGRTHAEYLRLSAAIQKGQTPECPRFTQERYIAKQPQVPFDIWRLSLPCTTLPKGKKLRIELAASALIHWTDDNWTNKQHTLTRDTYLDIHVAELSPRVGAAQLIFTFFWLTPGQWENRNYTVTLV